MKRGQQQNKAGFTLVEILTTIAVIAILLGFLVPALLQVQKKAQETTQKAQFHGIEIALESVYTDTGDYPPSEWNTARYGEYAAPQRLAEALVGRDGFGLHKDTIWHKEGTIDGNSGDGTNELYAPIRTPDKAERFGPYLELETANAVKLSTLYSSVPSGWADSFVLADMYKVTKNKLTNKLTGSPLLYYRANTNRTAHDPADVYNSTYNVVDATGTMSITGFTMTPEFGPLGEAGGSHQLTTSNAAWFYDRTANPNFPGPPRRPYKAESFILHSAGPDGVYGNADDIFNFDN